MISLPPEDVTDPDAGSRSDEGACSLVLVPACRSSVVVSADVSMFSLRLLPLTAFLSHARA